MGLGLRRALALPRNAKLSDPAPLRLDLPPQGDRIIRVWIGKAPDAAALDLTGADEPHQVLLYAQLGCPLAVNGLGQFQR